MSAGSVQIAFVILGGNPAYDAPADLDFTAAMAKVPSHHRAHARVRGNGGPRGVAFLTRDYLESWGDARAAGVARSASMQPLILPLFRRPYAG